MRFRGGVAVVMKRLADLRVLAASVVATFPLPCAAGGTAASGDPYLLVGSSRSGTDACCQLYEVFRDGGGAFLSLRGTLPFWSKAAQQLAFVRKHRIWIGSLDGRARRLEIGNYQAASVTWAPDGKRLAFGCGISTRNVIRGLCIATVSDPHVRRVVWLTADSDRWVLYPVWSPKGDSIAFDGSFDSVFTVRPDGTHLRRMTPAWSKKKPQWSEFRAWTRSGDRLSYIHQWRTSQVDGCALQCATLGHACSSVTYSTVTRVAWSPDGAAIAYSVNRKYCYTERLREQPTLIRKPELGCYGLTWMH